MRWILTRNNIFIPSNNDSVLRGLDGVSYLISDRYASRTVHSGYSFRLFIILFVLG